MQLTTERLQLHPFSDVDLTYLHGLWTEPQVRLYLWDDEIISRQVVREVIEASRRHFGQDGYGFWTLLDAEHRAPMGFAGLRPYGEEADIELLYGLDPRFWGRGLATEASRRVLRFAFETLGLDEVHAGADPPNQASFEVMVRLGMTFYRRLTVEGQEAIYYKISKQQFVSTPPDAVD